MQHWTQHLIAFRRHIMHYLLVFLVLFCFCFYYAKPLYACLAKPLLSKIPQPGNLLASQVTSPLFVPLQLALYCAFFLSIPYLFYQAWRFVAPGLYRHEKMDALPYIIFATVLFYLGVGFSYTLVLPLLFSFLTSALPAHILYMPDISNYLEFCLHFFVLFGFVFNIPLLMLLLVKAKWLTANHYKCYRPHVIVMAFVLGMLLTPPDVLSQVILALPIWALFELGILMCRWLNN